MDGEHAKLAADPSDVNPVLVELWRSNAVESFHRGAAAIATARGEIVAAWGDIDRPIFPRSAVKMLQALPLLETGAADRFSLVDTQIALACASHGGEPGHVRAVEAWLAGMGLAADALECGVQAPLNEQAAQDLLTARQSPTPLHNNCSGKHAGFLTIALHKGCSLRNYIAPSHPVQRLVTDTLSEMTEVDLERTPCGIDGCGIPVRAMPLRAIARAMAKLAVPEALPPPRAQAARRIVAAMLAEPWLVSGTGRFDARAMAAGERARLVVKMGAEGVHAAMAPAAGLGIALKIDDGARRAAEVAMAAMLRFVGLLSEEAYGALVAEPVRNNRGELVGKIGPAAGWPWRVAPPGTVRIKTPATGN